MLENSGLKLGARSPLPTDLFKSEALGETGTATGAATGVDTGAVSAQIGGGAPNMITLALLAGALYWVVKG